MLVSSARRGAPRRSRAADHGVHRDDGAGDGDVARARGHLSQRPAHERGKLTRRAICAATRSRGRLRGTTHACAFPASFAAREGGSMVAADHTTRSAWMDVPAPDYAPLRENITADVCVVGAGIAGLTTAYTGSRRPQRRGARRRPRRRRQDAPHDGPPRQRHRRPLRPDRAAPRRRGGAARGREPHGRHRPHRSHRGGGAIDCDFAAPRRLPRSCPPASRTDARPASSRRRTAPG